MLLVIGFLIVVGVLLGFCCSSETTCTTCSKSITIKLDDAKAEGIHEEGKANEVHYIHLPRGKSVTLTVQFDD